MFRHLAESVSVPVVAHLDHGYTFEDCRQALDSGFTPASIILDAPIVVDTGADDLWKPKISSGRFYGPAPMRIGLERSRNLGTDFECFSPAYAVVLLQVRGQVMPLDQLHHKVRMALLSRSGIEHLGDIRVVHQCQSLPFRLEASDHLTRVHAWLDDLEGDYASDRFALLRHPHRAHAAAAQHAVHAVLVCKEIPDPDLVQHVVASWDAHVDTP